MVKEYWTIVKGVKAEKNTMLKNIDFNLLLPEGLNFVYAGFNPFLCFHQLNSYNLHEKPLKKPLI